MALERIDLSGEICISEACTVLKFSDTTGFLVTACVDDYNVDGYGLTGGITLNSVTQAVLNVYFVGQTVPFIFTFAITNAVITECILTDLNGTETDITDSLVSTVFPLTDFQINLSDYGVTFPELTDGRVEWDYTISGISSSQSFDYTTSDGQLVDCTLDCCIEKKYRDLDLNCGCVDGKIDDLVLGEIFLWGARFSMNVGQDDKVDDFMAKGNEICNNNCKDC